MILSEYVATFTQHGYKTVKPWGKVLSALPFSGCSASGYTGSGLQNLNQKAISPHGRLNCWFICLKADAFR